MKFPKQKEEIRVLVIDDQAFVRRIVTMLLRQAGFQDIGEAKDGASGLEAVASFRPHLVICDIEMQPVDGLEFLETLRRGSLPLPKVIFLTSHGESEMVVKARDLGVDAFVLKPVTGPQLERRIDHVIGA
ncbi:MAG: response regulator [Alphaproteobacteria bacterium]|nr:response regulator [Alphaproteobacteria bacterium]